jgi:hypothetical protein
MRLMTLACAMLAVSLQAEASIPVQSYAMYDWSSVNSWDWYSDQTYSGDRNSGWLSGGTGELTDGFVARGVGAGYSDWSPYVLWDGSSPVITFDLGERYRVDSVVASFLAYPNAAVYIPLSAMLRFSDDGLTFGSLITHVFTAAERALGNDVQASYALLAAPVSGRFVELTLETPDRWIALSEVTFAGMAAPVPEPETYPLMLAGLGLVGFAARRRAAPAN